METANILICEDERLVARDIEACLKRHGYNVVGIASNAEEALELAEEKSPDLALMDIRLKGELSGIEIAAVLSNQYEIPSIYLTAYADEETLEEAKATMPLSYLLKPFDERELKTAVEMGLYRHRAQNRIVGALQSYITQLSDNDQTEKAVELEREFMETERINSLVRVGGNIAERLSPHLKMIGEQIEPVSNHETVGQEQRGALKGALIFHDQSLQFIEKLVKIAKPAGLKLEEVTFETLAHDAMQATKRLVGGEVCFMESFPQEPLIGLVDRKQITEALTNVFLNAHQATVNDAAVQDGAISVVMSLVYEELPERFNTQAKPGWFVAIKVRDSGKGIDKEILRRIFEPGFSASHLPLSSGLGLCQVHSALQQHLGWVAVDSSPDHGTRVSLFLPCADSPDKINVSGGSKSEWVM